MTQWKNHCSKGNNNKAFFFNCFYNLLKVIKVLPPLKTLPTTSLNPSKNKNKNLSYPFHICLVLNIQHIFELLNAHPPKTNAFATHIHSEITSSRTTKHKMNAKHC